MGGERSIRLEPFSEYSEQVACVVNNCPSVRTALLFLLVNGLGNVVVFMPLGALLYAASRLHFNTRTSLWTASLVGLGFAVIYEVAQLWIPGRVAATDDVILNAAGSLLGAWAVNGLAYRHQADGKLGSEGLDGR
jgi:VanZ family protein